MKLKLVREHCGKMKEDRIITYYGSFTEAMKEIYKETEKTDSTGDEVRICFEENGTLRGNLDGYYGCCNFTLEEVVD